MIIRENVLLSDLTTMRLGGATKYVVDIEHVSEVEAAFDFAKEKKLPVFILGGGANTLGHDEGFNGVIIRNKILGIEINDFTAWQQDTRQHQADARQTQADVGQTQDRQPSTKREVMASTELPVTITVMGGEPWDEVVNYTTGLGLTGIEALSAIPGSAGAAPVQNIGAYGQEISQVLVDVTAYDMKDDRLVTIPVEEMQMGYRSTIFNHGVAKGRYFIISATLRLHYGQIQPPLYASLQKYLDEHQITDYAPVEIRRAVMAIRAEKLPDPEVIPSAGSFFKNVLLDDAAAEEAEAHQIPVIRKNGQNKINSGWLIEQCGLKGKKLHGMLVSEKAALVLINDSAKTYADLAAARKEIIEAVQSKFGYTLEQEPVEIESVDVAIYKKRSERGS